MGGGGELPPTRAGDPTEICCKNNPGQGKPIPNTERTASPYVLTSEGLRQDGGIMLVAGQVTYLAIFFALACFVAARYCNRRDTHQPEEQPEVRGLAPEVLAS